MNPVGLLIAAAGLIIVLGYALTAIVVAPNFRAERTLTRVGGVFFFMLCAGTHLELATHYLTGNPIGMSELESVHMALIHGPQALAVLMFIAGLHAENRLPTSAINPATWADLVLSGIARSRLINRFSDVLDRRLMLYAGGYAVVVLASSLLGI